jgi:hypothetical protein
VITDDVTLENAALRRQLQSVTQENLQLKKEISSASVRPDVARSFFSSTSPALGAHI